MGHTSCCLATLQGDSIDTPQKRGAHRADEVGLVVVVGGRVGLACIWRPVQLIVLADENGVHVV